MNSVATATLLMRLAGPMQSWGLDSRFDQRDTSLEPSKSGVLGLICAALGKPRNDQPGPWPMLSELASMKMGVRVLHEGTLRMDFQTAGGGDFTGRKSYGVWKASGKAGDTVVSPRHYLSNADFLVGLNGPQPLLQQISQALPAPVWQLSLGRKSYVPTLPLNPTILELELDKALRSFSPPEKSSKQQTKQRYVLETPLERAADRRPDVPISFLHRTFTVRGVETRWLEAINE